MIKKKILDASRIRHIDGGFSFIPHRFLTDGFLTSLQQPELLLYVFLVLAADRYGLSYYSYNRICSLLQLSTEQYITARDGFICQKLIDNLIVEQIINESQLFILDMQRVALFAVQFE